MLHKSLDFCCVHQFAAIISVFNKCDTHEFASVPQFELIKKKKLTFFKFKLIHLFIWYNNRTFSRLFWKFASFQLLNLELEKKDTANWEAKKNWTDLMLKKLNWFELCDYFFLVVRVFGNLPQLNSCENNLISQSNISKLKIFWHILWFWLFQID